MKVKELKELIKDLPDDLEIKTASDDEGNGFRNVPNGWCTVEKFCDGDLIPTEDINEYNSDDLTDYLLIG